MNNPIEDRIRKAALQLDDASERYQNAQPRVIIPERPNRRIATVTAIALAGATIAGVAIARRDSDHITPLAPSLASTASSASIDTPPTTATAATTDPTDTAGLSSTTTTAIVMSVPTDTVDASSSTFDPAHTPVSDSKGNHVGWADTTNRDDTIYVTLPESYTSTHPQSPTAIGVQIVRDDLGQPVGLLTGNGYIGGGVSDNGEIAPDVQTQIIDNAIATGIVAP